MLDGHEARRVSIVGQIRNVSKQTTNMTYKLDDGTGTIEVKVWNDRDTINDEFGEPVVETKQIETGMWARATGEVKHVGKKHIGAHNIKQITDMNEINYHLLEATYVHLYFTKGPREPGSAGGEGGAQEQGGYGAQNGGDYGNALMGISAHGKMVYKFLKEECTTQEGLHMQQIASMLGMNMADVGKAGDELIQHSLIFPTIDDHTWVVMQE